MADEAQTPEDLSPGSDTTQDRHEITLEGGLTFGTASDQMARLLAQLGDRDRLIEVNMGGVTAIDAAGTQVLVELYKILKLRGGQLSLLQVPPVIMKELERRQLDQVLNIAVRSEPQHAPKSAATDPAAARSHVAPSVVPRGAMGAPAPPGVRVSIRLKLMLAAGVVLAVLVAAQRLGGDQHPALSGLRDAHVRVGTSNARLVASLLQDHYRQHRRYPARAEQVQALLSQRQLRLVNVFSGQPLRVLSPRAYGPGDLTYRPDGHGYAIGVLDADSLPIRDARGRELIIAPPLR